LVVRNDPPENSHRPARTTTLPLCLHYRQIKHIRGSLGEKAVPAHGESKRTVHYRLLHNHPADTSSCSEPQNTVTPTTSPPLDTGTREQHFLAFGVRKYYFGEHTFCNEFRGSSPLSSIARLSQTATSLLVCKKLCSSRLFRWLWGHPAAGRTSPAQSHLQSSTLRKVSWVSAARKTFSLLTPLLTPPPSDKVCCEQPRCENLCLSETALERGTKEEKEKEGHRIGLGQVPCEATRKRRAGRLRMPSMVCAP